MLPVSFLECCIQSNDVVSFLFLMSKTLSEALLKIKNPPLFRKGFLFQMNLFLLVKN